MFSILTQISCICEFVSSTKYAQFRIIGSPHFRDKLDNLFHDEACIEPSEFLIPGNSECNEEKKHTKKRLSLDMMTSDPTANSDY